MRPMAFEITELAAPDATGALVVHQSNRSSRLLIKSGLMIGLAALIIVPQLALALIAMVDAGVRAAMIEHPSAALQLAVALVFWVTLVTVPVASTVRRSGLERTLRIASGLIEITDVRGTDVRAHGIQVQEFRGLARDIRTSLTGSRHELVLIHPDPSKSLVLISKDQAQPIDFIWWRDRLGLPLMTTNTRQAAPLGTQSGTAALPAAA